MLPELMLLGFAIWTLVLLFATVGVYRWSRIFRGSARISEFRADQITGQDWYQRSMRAHANCVENLPVFATLVYVLHAGGIVSPAVNAACAVVLAARIAQSLVHVCFVQTDRVNSVRFAFYFVQFISFFVLTTVIVTHLSLHRDPASLSRFQVPRAYGGQAAAAACCPGARPPEAHRTRA